MLEKAATLSGASRIAVFHAGKHGPQLDAGSRFSHQLFEALLPQLDFSQATPFSKRVVLGVQQYECLVLQMTEESRSNRYMLALFKEDVVVTPQIVGRLEGVFHSWWKMADMLPAHAHDHLVHVCSACQDVHVEGHGWVKWDEYLQRVQKLTLSHTVCDCCCGELYGSLSPALAGTSA